jgi:replicative DNA helicase
VIAPHDLDAEGAVIGACLMAGSIPPSVVDTGLHPAHFYSSTNANAWQKILALYDQGEPVDDVTLGSRLGLSPGEVSGRYLPVVNISGAASHAELVKDVSRWRDRLHAAYRIQEAVQNQDEDLFAAAESSLIRVEDGDHVYGPERLGSILHDRLEAGEVETFPLPFARLNELLSGGLRRGQVTLVGGWTSHGKSVFVDQVAAGVARFGTVWAWINEMAPEERGGRMLSAMSGVSLDRIERAVLSPAELSRVVPALNALPFGVVAVPGWSVEAICRDIRVRRPDLAVLDIIHEIPHRDHSDLGHIMRVLAATAKLGNVHILATVHLNRGRLQAAARPQPTLADLKGASSLEQAADNVLFVWREDDEDTGLPGTDGQVYVAKARQGRTGGVSVTFDGDHSRFRPNSSFRSGDLTATEHQERLRRTAA